MTASDNFSTIKSYLPSPGGVIDWQALEGSALGGILDGMRMTEQEPQYHAEGNVYEHTKLVTEAMIKLPIYAESDERDRTVLFFASLLHDIGKIRVTKRENG